MDEQSCIGRYCVVAWNNRAWVCNVLDMVAGTNTPKRVRIQQHALLQGRVLQPSEYTFKQWADEEDD